MDPAFVRAVRTTWSDRAPGFNQVFKLSRQCVVAEVRVLRFKDSAEHDSAFFSGVCGNLAERFLQGAFQNDTNARNPSDNGHSLFHFRQPERSQLASPSGLWSRRTALLALLAGS